MTGFGWSGSLFIVLLLSECQFLMENEESSQVEHPYVDPHILFLT
jgi:hypothetical protein